MGGHHSIWFDPYSRAKGPIGRLPPSAKLAAALAVVLLVVLTPMHGRFTPFVYAAALLFLVSVTALSALSPVRVMKRVLFLEPVVLGAALLALFQPNGKAIFLLLVIRSTLCIWTATLLAATTPFEDLLAVMRRLHLPRLLLTTLALMYRYLSLLSDQSQRMRRARASRTFNPGLIPIWRNLSSLIGHLFIRATDRSERVYAAMCARGWE